MPLAVGLDSFEQTENKIGYHIYRWGNAKQAARPRCSRGRGGR